MKRFLLAALLLAALSAPASPHSDGAMIYDADCCSGIDCAPVERAESSAIATAAGLVPSQLTVTTRHGSATVPVDFPMRQSRDGRMHACIRMGILICLYMPPTN